LSKPKERMVSLQVRFPKSLLTDLEGIAAEDGRTLAGLLRFISERHVRSVRLSKAIGDREDFGEIIKIADALDKRVREVESEGKEPPQ
jgi:hypothetical protein